MTLSITVFLLPGTFPALSACIWDGNCILKLNKNRCKIALFYFIGTTLIVEAVPLSWGQQPRLEICLLLVTFQPLGCWGLTRVVATYLPLSHASIFSPVPSVPSMQFAKDLLLVKEKEGVLHVPIIRNGDLSYESSVRCYTQGHSAQVMEDFEERRNADSSRITFLKGEKVSGFMVAEKWNSFLP